MVTPRLEVLCICLLLSIPLLNAQDISKAAASAYTKGNYAAAIEYYEKLLIDDPDNGVYHHNLGVSYLLSNSHKVKAIAHLEAAEKIEGYETEVIYHLARSYHLNNEFDQAIETYLRYQRESGGRSEKVDRHIGNCYSAKKLITKPVSVS
ncbi:MAG: tetratricopeptide repeat protein, partial [Flavobacteriales bacterium]|nr:tetratricopeptide repeat protein [Flavobacteriales bacterium]